MKTTEAKQMLAEWHQEYIDALEHKDGYATQDWIPKVQKKIEAIAAALGALDIALRIERGEITLYYTTCPNCGSNLDPGEKCNCMEIGRKTTKSADEKNVCSQAKLLKREGTHESNRHCQTH